MLGRPQAALVATPCSKALRSFSGYCEQGVLSKLSAAKELMKEILAREKKKTAEREAAKVPPPPWAVIVHCCPLESA